MNGIAKSTRYVKQTFVSAFKHFFYLNLLLLIKRCSLVLFYIHVFICKLNYFTNQTIDKKKIKYQWLETSTNTQINNPHKRNNILNKERTNYGNKNFQKKYAILLARRAIKCIASLSRPRCLIFADTFPCILF